MAKELLIQKGLVFQHDPKKDNTGIALFSFDKWLTRMCKKRGIQEMDCCEKAAQTGFPVRLSLDKSTIEYFDIDNTWKPKP